MPNLFFYPLLAASSRGIIAVHNKIKSLEHPDTAKVEYA